MLIDVREREGGTILVRQKWSPPPSRERREGAGGKEAKDHLETARGGRGRGRGRGGPYLSDKSRPPGQQVWREETCRQTTLETVFKVDLRERREQK